MERPRVIGWKRLLEEKLHTKRLRKDAKNASKRAKRPRVRESRCAVAASRRVVVVSLCQCDSCPSDEADGWSHFFLILSAFRIATRCVTRRPCRQAREPVPVDALKAKHAIAESFEAAQIYDQLLADFT